MKLEFKEGFGLIYIDGELEKSVSVKRSFPNSHPDKYFSILNDENQELMFIESLERLNEGNRKILNKYFSRLDFKLKVTKVFKVKDEFGLRNWEVETSSGKRKFQSALDSWPIRVDENEFVLEDLNGDKYWIDLKYEFDEESRKQLSFYLD